MFVSPVYVHVDLQLVVYISILVMYLVVCDDAHATESS
jgi:hypothetical protein